MGTFVFDGDCAFCSSSARLLRRILAPHHRVVPYQRTDLGALRLTREQAHDAAWWVDERGRGFRGHEAFARALESSHGAWRAAGRLLGSSAARPLGARLYEAIARNRHRLPGGRPECRLP